MLRNGGNERKTNFEISCRRAQRKCFEREHLPLLRLLPRRNNLIKLPQFFKSAGVGRCYWNLHDFYCLGISNFFHKHVALWQWPPCSARAASAAAAAFFSPPRSPILEFLPFGGCDEVNWFRKSTVIARNLLKVQPQFSNFFFCTITRENIDT